MSQSAQIVSVQLICMFALLAKLIRTSSSMLMTTKGEIEAMRICSSYILSFVIIEKIESIRGAVVLQISCTGVRHKGSLGRWHASIYSYMMVFSYSGVGEGE